MGSNSGHAVSHETGNQAKISWILRWCKILVCVQCRSRSKLFGDISYIDRNWLSLAASSSLFQLASHCPDSRPGHLDHGQRVPARAWRTWHIQTAGDLSLWLDQGAHPTAKRWKSKAEVALALHKCPRSGTFLHCESRSKCRRQIKINVEALNIRCMSEEWGHSQALG